MNAIRDGSVLKIRIEYRVVQFFIPISHLTQTHPVDAIAPEQITRNNKAFGPIKALLPLQRFHVFISICIALQLSAASVVLPALLQLSYSA
jgi:hypothetical protein